MLIFITNIKAIIDSCGYVWFFKYGKHKISMSALSTCCNKIIIKESGKTNGSYLIVEYSDLTKNNPKDKAIPTYYQTITKESLMWFKITNISQIEDSILEDSFVGKSSGGSINQIAKSMCPAFFIKCIKDIEI